MAFNLVNTIPFDTTDSDSVLASFDAGLDYLFRTFIPARTGCGTNLISETSSNKKFTIQLPMRDAFNNEATEYNYFWIDWNYTSITNTLTLREDSTYTTVPGDKGTDSTNSVAFNVYSGSGALSSSDWKYWVSDQDDACWFVSRGDYSILGWMHPLVNVIKSNSDYPESPSTDRWMSQIWPTMQEAWRWTNLPASTNTSTSEGYGHGLVPSKYGVPLEQTFYTDWIFTQTNQGYGLGQVTNPDIIWSTPAASFRATSDTWGSSSNSSPSMAKYLVNGTDWYAVHHTPSNSTGGFGYYMGTTEPAFDS